MGAVTAALACGAVPEASAKSSSRGGEKHRPPRRRRCDLRPPRHEQRRGRQAYPSSPPGPRAHSAHGDFRLLRLLRQRRLRRAGALRRPVRPWRLHSEGHNALRPGASCSLAAAGGIGLHAAGNCVRPLAAEGESRDLSAVPDRNAIALSRPALSRSLSRLPRPDQPFLPAMAAGTGVCLIPAWTPTARAAWALDRVLAMASLSLIRGTSRSRGDGDESHRAYGGLTAAA